jgi:hypothetical protein
MMGRGEKGTVGVENATYRRTPSGLHLQLYHKFAPRSAHMALPLISRLQASASEIERGMARRTIPVPETHIVGMVCHVDPE